METEEHRPIEIEINATADYGGFPVVRANKITETYGQCILIYGPPGVGKTPMAANVALSPVVKKGLVFLDAEGGTRSIAHMDTVDIIPMYKWADWVRFRVSLIRNPKDFPWDAVVVDNVSEFADMSLAKIMIDNAVDLAGFKEFRENTGNVLDMVRFCRDAARKWGIIFILIAWDTDEKQGTADNAPIKKHISFTPSLQEKLPGIVDMIGYMSIDLRGQPNKDGDRPRLISFAPSRNTVAKFRRSKDDVAMKVPLEIYDTDITALRDVVSTLKGGLPFPKTHEVPARTQVQAPTQAQE